MPALTPQTFSFALLAGAALLCYVATRTLVRVAGGRATAIGTAAWVPVALTMAVAAARGRWELALSLAFAASVLGVLLLGGVMLVATPGGSAAISKRMRLLLPVTVALVLCGFRGTLTLVHAAVLLMLGGIAAALWRDGATRVDPVSTDAEPERGRGMSIAFAALGLVLAGLGGWYAIEAVRIFEHAAGRSVDGPAAALMLAPATLLAMIGLSSDAGRLNRSVDATTAAATLVLLNLALAVPVLILAWGATHGSVADDAGGAWAFLLGNTGLPFAVVKWRLDAVLLALAAVWLFPAAVGRWRLGRIEGVVMLLAYLLYVAASARAMAM